MGARCFGKSPGVKLHAFSIEDRRIAVQRKNERDRDRGGGGWGEGWGEGRKKNKKQKKEGKKQQQEERQEQTEVWNTKFMAADLMCR